MKYLLIILVLFFLFLLGSCTQNPNEECSTAVYVIDGDTFILSTGEKVRLIGIDTPEKNEPYSLEAASTLKSLILNKCIYLEKDTSNKDQYGRLLRYVYADNISVNEALVKNGLAESFPYPPDIKYASKFDSLEIYAKNNKLGMWSQYSMPAVAS